MMYTMYDIYVSINNLEFEFEFEIYLHILLVLCECSHGHMCYNGFHHYDIQGNEGSTYMRVRDFLRLQLYLKEICIKYAYTKSFIML